MTKKEIYTIALKTTQTALRAYFDDATGFKPDYLQKTPKGKAMVKKVYDAIEPTLLTQEESK
jgi:hypothetical protein